MYKILIIEDDLVMAGAIKKEMEAWGNEARYVDHTLQRFLRHLQSMVHIWCFWISRFLFIMDTTGAARSVRYRAFR